MIPIYLGMLIGSWIQINKPSTYLYSYHYKIVPLVVLQRSAQKWVLISSKCYICLIVTGKAGIRESCPVFKYFFKILLEIVGTAIRQIKEMKRIQIGKEED